MFLTLFLKEVSSYFRTKLAYFIMLIYALLSMLTSFYLGNFFALPSTDLASLFFFQPDIFALLLPALCIKLWAEENKTGSIEILLTQPVSFFDLVFSKFFACFSVGVLMLTLTFPLWILSGFIVNLDNTTIISSYLACIFAIASLSALSCLVSSFNKSPVIAYIIALFVSWGFIIGNFSFIVSGQNQVLFRALQSLNFSKNYSDISQGQIGFDNIIYFAVIIALSLWINIYLVSTHFAKTKKLFYFILIQIFSGILIIFLSAILFSPYKFDMSSGKQYTISKASQKILKDLKTPVFADVYISSNLSEEYPAFAGYAQVVVRFLQKLKNVQVSIKQVEPYSSQEKEAKRHNLQSFLDNSGKYNLYFGAVFQNEYGQKAVIDFFDENQKKYLEQDVLRSIAKLSIPNPKTIGIFSGLLPVMQKAYGLERGKNWKFVQELAKFYKVQPVFGNIAQIPLNINVLLVINPEKVEPLFIYALDQFVMRGGRLLILNDSFSENSVKTSGFANLDDSNLNILYNNWGINYLKNELIGDKASAKDEIIAERVQKYPLYFNPVLSNNPIVSSLKGLSLYTTGGFEVIGKDGVNITPLLTTSAQGGKVDSYLAKYTSKSNVLDKYQDTNQEYVLGALIEGDFTSKFQFNPVADVKYAKKMIPHLILSIESNKIIILGDSDIIGNQDIFERDDFELVLRSIDYLADNKAVVDLGAKDINVSNASFYGVIEAMVLQNYKLRLDTLEREILQLQGKISQISQGLSVSISNYKDIEQWQTDIIQKQEQINELEYKITEYTQNYAYLIIILTTLIFPIFLILIVALIFIFLRKKYVQI